VQGEGSESSEDYDHTGSGDKYSMRLITGTEVDTYLSWGRTSLLRR
jgi:hypothetical protein